MNLLEFDSVHLEFADRQILTNIYMKCQTGEIVGLLGRNGTGKSCLMKIVFGTGSCTHKSVRINGRPLMNNYLSKKQISYLPQGNFIPSFISLQTAVRMFKSDLREAYGFFPEVERQIRCKQSQLSTGQRRLVEVLLILFSSHPFCILDEPFSGMAPRQIEQLCALLEIATKKKGIIITDHLYNSVWAVSDRVYVLSGGRTKLVDDKEELIGLGYVGSHLR